MCLSGLREGIETEDVVIAKFRPDRWNYVPAGYDKRGVWRKYGQDMT